MRPQIRAALVIFALASSGVQAQTMRNPKDATPPAGPTRNPSGPAPSQAGADRGGAQLGGGAPTRPPLGSEPANRASGATGPTGGIGPNGIGGNGTGLGGPGVTNANGANAGASPGPLSGSRPNGGSQTNGAKPSPMRANGVREVQ